MYEVLNTTYNICLIVVLVSLVATMLLELVLKANRKFLNSILVTAIGFTVLGIVIMLVSAF